MARSFQDNTGGTWEIIATATTLAAVEQELGDKFFGGGAFESIMDDPMVCFRAVVVLCRSQMLDQNITDEQLSDRLVGDAIDDAARAIIHAVADFVPKARGDALRAAMLALMETRDKALAITAERVDGVDTDGVAKELAGAMNAGQP